MVPAATDSVLASARAFFIGSQPLDFVYRIFHSNAQTANGKPDDHTEKHSDEQMRHTITSFLFIVFTISIPL